MMHPYKALFGRLHVGLMLLLLAGPGAVSFASDQPAPQEAIPNVRIQKDIVYATVEKIDLKLDLYIPQDSEGPLPLVVWVHGGGWREGSRQNPPAQPLLKQGFAVAGISYRFSNAAIFPAQIHDCKAAIRFLRANADTYNIDPNRIGAWGGSAGGHLVSLLGTTNGNKQLEGSLGEHTATSSAVQAVCDWFGPTDFLTAPINEQLFKDDNPVTQLLGGKVSEKFQLAELASPLTHVSKDAPPFLIMHGDQDNVVPLRQSQLLYDRLKGEGVDAALIVMKGMGHSLSQSPEAFSQVVAFFERTLKKNEVQSMFETDTFKTAGGDLVISFIGHGTLMLQWAGKTIHVDPWTNLADYSQLPDADIILITHDHRDHLDPAAIEQIRRESTTVIVPQCCAEQVPNSTVMPNGDTQKLGEQLTVEAVPAYNIEHQRPGGIPYHPKGEGNGYVIDFADTRVYIAGDTENVPEMANLKNVDVAFLPMNLPYTMSPEMAAAAARLFKPKILYPYHYGESDVDKLVQLLENEKDTEVRIRSMQ